MKTELTSGGTVMELSSRGKIARQEWFVEQNGWKQALEPLGFRSSVEVLLWTEAVA